MKADNQNVIDKRRQEFILRYEKAFGEKLEIKPIQSTYPVINTLNFYDIKTKQ